MAVLKAKPQKIVKFYLGMLQQGLITPLVVTRATDADFKGALNDTVTLKIDGLTAVARDYEFRSRVNPIQFDDISGGEGIDVKLDTHVVSGTLLTDEHWTLDDIDFAEEVVEPQVEAVVKRFEAKVVAGLRAAAVRHTVTFDSADDPHLVALEAKRLMDSDKVAPAAGRTFLVGSNVAAAFLASDRLSKYESTGQTGTPALRDAIIGKLSNSPVLEVPELDPDEAYYLHKSGLVLGNVAPRVPQGATQGRTGISKDGFAVRWLQDYDPQYLRDRSIVSSFLGVNDVRDRRNPDGTLWEAGADRRNVRIVKLGISDGGSVFDGGVTHTDTP